MLGDCLQFLHFAAFRRNLSVSHWKMSGLFKCSNRLFSFCWNQPARFSRCLYLNRNKVTYPPLLYKSMVYTLFWSRNLFTSASVPLWEKWFVKEIRPEYSVDTQELEELVKNDKIYLVDVREPEEVAAGRVPAKRYVHVPIGHFYPDMQLSEEEFFKKYGKEKPQKDADDIVFSCKRGIRSTFALQLAQHFGYSKSKHYRDGYMVWEATYKQ